MNSHYVPMGYKPLIFFFVLYTDEALKTFVDSTETVRKIYLLV